VRKAKHDAHRSVRPLAKTLGGGNVTGTNADAEHVQCNAGFDGLHHFVMGRFGHQDGGIKIAVDRNSAHWLIYIRSAHREKSDLTGSRARMPENFKDVA
jgi:hypothetical protein